MINDKQVLRLQPLTAEKVDQAYAVVELVARDVSLASWRNFARQQISRVPSPSAGILTVQDRRGYIFGLASYATGDHLRDLRTLIVDHLIVVATTNRQRDTALLALLGAAENIAGSRHCGTIQYRLEAFRSAELIQHARCLLKASGFDEKYDIFSKALEHER